MVAILYSPGIYGNHDALAAELVSALCDKAGVKHCRRIYGDLVRPRQQHAPHIIYVTQSTADRERHKYLPGYTLNDISHGITPFRGGCDIQKDKLISAFTIVKASQFYRIAGIAQIDEAFPLYHPATFHIEAGDNSLGQHFILSPRLVPLP
jgi:hypothetical protein